MLQTPQQNQEFEQIQQLDDGNDISNLQIDNKIQLKRQSQNKQQLDSINIKIPQKEEQNIEDNIIQPFSTFDQQLKVFQQLKKSDDFEKDKYIRQLEENCKFFESKYYPIFVENQKLKEQIIDINRRVNERANEILVLTVSGEQTDSGENKTISQNEGLSGEQRTISKNDVFQEDIFEILKKELSNIREQLFLKEKEKNELKNKIIILSEEFFKEKNFYYDEVFQLRNQYQKIINEHNQILQQKSDELIQQQRIDNNTISNMEVQLNEKNEQINNWEKEYKQLKDEYRNRETKNLEQIKNLNKEVLQIKTCMNLQNQSLEKQSQLLLKQQKEKYEQKAIQVSQINDRNCKKTEKIIDQHKTTIDSQKMEFNNLKLQSTYQIDEFNKKIYELTTQYSILQDENIKNIKEIELLNDLILKYKAIEKEHNEDKQKFKNLYEQYQQISLQYQNYQKNKEQLIKQLEQQIQIQDEEIKKINKELELKIVYFNQEIYQLKEKHQSEYRLRIQSLVEDYESKITELQKQNEKILPTNMLDNTQNNIEIQNLKSQIKTLLNEQRELKYQHDKQLLDMNKEFQTIKSNLMLEQQLLIQQQQKELDDLQEQYSQILENKIEQIQLFENQLISLGKKEQNRSFELVQLQDDYEQMQKQLTEEGNNKFKELMEVIQTSHKLIKDLQQQLGIKIEIQQELLVNENNYTLKFEERKFNQVIQLNQSINFNQSILLDVPIKQIEKKDTSRLQKNQKVNKKSIKSKENSILTVINDLDNLEEQPKIENQQQQIQQQEQVQNIEKNWILQPEPELQNQNTDLNKSQKLNTDLYKSQKFKKNRLKDVVNKVFMDQWEKMYKDLNYQFQQYQITKQEEQKILLQQNENLESNTYNLNIRVKQLRDELKQLQNKCEEQKKQVKSITETSKNKESESQKQLELLRKKTSDEIFTLKATFTKEKNQYGNEYQTTLQTLEKGYNENMNNIQKLLDQTVIQNKQMKEDKEKYLRDTKNMYDDKLNQYVKEQLEFTEILQKDFGHEQQRNKQEITL